jgi:hypothetical protein
MACRVANIRTYRGSMDDAVYVGRPSPYGNPYRLYEDCGNDRLACIAKFAAW